MIEYRCPRCNFTKTFTTKAGFLNAKNNPYCNFCKGVDLSNISGSVYIKHCPICNEIQEYSQKSYLITALIKGTICYACNSRKNTPASGTHWSEESKKKASNAWLERYKSGYISPTIGKKHPMSDSQKKKLSKIFTKKYSGKNHWIHRPNALDKFLKHRYKRKTFTLPSGKMVSVQGYEPYALLSILSSGISEKDIVIENNKKPKIKYIFQGKEKTYYPDFYIPAKNEIVEVKSTYTIQADVERNKAKVDAVLKSGYNIRIMVFDGNKRLVKSDLTETKS